MGFQVARLKKIYSIMGLYFTIAFLLIVEHALNFYHAYGIQYKPLYISTVLTQTRLRNWYLL